MKLVAMNTDKKSRKALKYYWKEGGPVLFVLELYVMLTQYA